MPAARFKPSLLTNPRPAVDDPRSDADLLAHFLTGGDEAAFAVLVARHTPAVRAACRGWLRSPADVDDAAQATFLVLVRRAGSIREPAALPRWLYRVAGNVARRLRRQLAKAGPLPADVPDRPPPAGDDRADVLAEEVARLPEKYRLPVQLCYGAGLTTAAAAERLGCPKGTVLTRLARGRDLLFRRLAARGAAPGVLLAGPGARAVDPAWVWVTVRAAKAVAAGESLTSLGVSGRTVTLTEGAVRAMVWKKLKLAVAAAMVATGLIGFVVGQWASADPSGPLRKGTGDPGAAAKPAPPEKAAPAGDPARPDDAKPPVPGRRREAVIRLPVGTFVKEVDVPPYGSGRITWTYEEDRVLGLIEVSVMGVEVELATEAEFSLSSTGTIYGVLTGVRLNHVRLPDGGEFAELKPFLGLWPLVEPLIGEILTDMPFSYQFRVQGDRLVLMNFRMMMSGPVGKLASMAALGGSNGGGEAVLIAGGFQAVGTAIEGTYTAADARDKEKDDPRPRPMFKKPIKKGGTPAKK